MKKQLTLIVLLFALLTHAQPSQLKLEDIMAGNQYIGQQPFNPLWNPDGKSFIFSWNPQNELTSSYYLYELKTKKTKRIDNFDTQIYPIKGYHSSPNKLFHYFVIENAIYRWHHEKSVLLYESIEPIRIVSVSNENSLIVQLGVDSYHICTANFQVKKITNIKDAPLPSPKAEPDFLTRQQHDLFEYIRKEESISNATKHNKNVLLPNRLTPYYLDEWSLTDIAISSNADAFILFLTSYHKNEETHVEHHITEDGYTTIKSARPKVGAKNPKHQVVIYRPSDSTNIIIDFNHLSEINARPNYHQEYPKLLEKEYTKDIIIHNHGFNNTNEKCLVEIKSYDNKDRWIGYVDILKEQFVEIEHQHSESWIGGPGISGWNMVPGTVGWISENEIYYQSEKTGYSHLYIKKLGSEAPNQLTQGNYEVHEAILASDKKSFFISSNQSHSGNRSFYKLDIASKNISPILADTGNYEVQISPDEKNLLIRYSNQNTPWELYTFNLDKPAKMIQVTESQSLEFKRYPWRKPELKEIVAKDSTRFQARLYLPEEEKKNGAAIFFVHGAGYLQNAHNWWSVYYREYMFHNLLCDLGYTVMDVDYRGSEGYGEKFRTGIYRHMGGKDLEDHLDARKYLIEAYNIDSSRIGIYGGSYGGFITLMALLTEPGKFKCGAAIRSVTDWAHYNHPYTSNILNTHQEDPIAFKRSSPIYFAENLSDRLLMLHGMVDDNVQYQDVVRLSQRFIELGKKKWDLIGYPVEPHGFIQTSSWIDEYRRILDLFNAELLDKNKVSK